MRLLRFIVFLTIIIATSCQSYNPHYKEEIKDAQLLRESVGHLTDVIVHDIFSPPVASRIYAYSTIAAYECARLESPDNPSFAGRLNDLEILPKPKEDLEYSFYLASLYAFDEVGKQLTFSNGLYEEKIAKRDSLIEAIRIPKDITERSKAFGVEMAGAILEWSSKDHYKETRSYPRFDVKDEEGRWKPTPPAYMEAIEPAWREIRPFVLDSAQQFRPAPPTPVDYDKESVFYKETMEVYDTVKDANEEEREIASFWDCNPYAMNITGHVMVAVKKITPGGHWMEITTIATRKEQSDFIRTAEAYAKVAVSIADGFISCWDEKYNSNLIRPETVINEHIDPTWKPILQTPPFPEYTSGHSVISSSAAICLTELFGDFFAFDDDSEIKYGLPVRSFESFIQASEEAAISRLYGGIHYRPAIENGVAQGRAVGQFINKKLKWDEL